MAASSDPFEHRNTATYTRRRKRRSYGYPPNQRLPLVAKVECPDCDGLGDIAGVRCIPCGGTGDIRESELVR